MNAKLERELDKAFRGAFMQPEIEHGTWWEVDGPSGTEYFPEDFFSKEEALENYSAASGKTWSITKRHGYGARIQAPGYLDSTEWSVFDTEEEAAEYLIEYYGEENEEDSDEEE